MGGVSMTKMMMDPVPEENRRELSINEQVHWWGRPRQEATLRRSDVLAIPLSFLWCGFAFFWEYSALQVEKAPGFLALWGIPFVCVGLYVVFGRFFADAKQRAKIYYAVSNERILIISGLFNRRVKSLNIRTLTDVSVTEKRGGEGLITFGPQPPFASFFGGMQGLPGGDRLVGPRFDLIQNAKQVYEVIRKLQR